LRRPTTLISTAWRTSIIRSFLYVPASCVNHKTIPKVSVPLSIVILLKYQYELLHETMINCDDTILPLYHFVVYLTTFSNNVGKEECVSCRSNDRYLSNSCFKNKNNDYSGRRSVWWLTFWIIICYQTIVDRWNRR
jgi:hypothetical protein